MDQCQYVGILQGIEGLAVAIAFLCILLLIAITKLNAIKSILESRRGQ